MVFKWLLLIFINLSYNYSVSSIDVVIYVPSYYNLPISGDSSYNSLQYSKCKLTDFSMLVSN